MRKNKRFDVELGLKKAIGARGVEEAVLSLICLHGVGVKTASAILTAIDPKRYTILDFRALEALGVENSQSLNLYVLYVEACRNMAREYGVTMRDFDRANWQWSKTHKPRIAARETSSYCKVRKKGDTDRGKSSDGSLR